jgi:putative FmdB family regulatory protein
LKGKIQMPLYEYKCRACGCEFEDLVGLNDERESRPCKKCGNVAERKMSRFASVIAGGSGTEPVDMTIGREADKRWQMHYDKQAKRRGTEELKPVELPRTSDGEFMPVMGLGDKVQKEKRQEYTTALQEHRQERVKKGQEQFTESGAF